MNVADLLSALRLGLVPVLLALAWTGNGEAFVACLAVSLATDVADGWIARRLARASLRGAVLDSRADFATYMSLPLAAWWSRLLGLLGIWLALSVTAISRGVAMALFWNSGRWRSVKV